jgi:hypothetical protein
MCTNAGRVRQLFPWALLFVLLFLFMGAGGREPG